MDKKISFIAFIALALALPCAAQLTSEQVEALRSQQREELNRKADSVVTVLTSAKKVQERQAKNIVLEKVENSNFDIWRNSNRIFVVFFGSRYCPGCVAAEPLVTDLSYKYKGKAKIVKYDCQVSKQKFYEYKLDSYPAVIIFKDGQYTTLLHGKTEIVLNLEKEIVKALK